MHRLGDIGGVIAHALDILGAEHEMDAERNVARVFHHVGQELAEQRGAHGVDLFVALPYRQRLVEVVTGIAVEHLLELSQHQGRHVLNAAQELLRMEVAGDRSHALGDVRGEVADPLEVVGQAQRAHDLAQIDRHGLAARDGEHGLFLDLALQGVDGGIDRHYAARPLEVALGQRIDRIRDLLLGQAAHLRHHAGELLKIDVEGFRRVLVHHHCCCPRRRGGARPQPKRPVM
jgi:hypothetical protein